MQPLSQIQLPFSFVRLTANSRMVSCLYKSYATKYWLRQPLIEPDMTTVAMQRNRQEVENEEYRQRMLVNAVAASFITLMMIGGYWVVTTLAQVS
jgi:hypothetical protein